MFQETINGQKVTILFPRKRPKHWLKIQDGECRQHRDGSFTIRALATLSRLELIETVIHELRHAEHWHHSEEHVDQGAKDITRILDRLGFLK